MNTIIKSVSITFILILLINISLSAQISGQIFTNQEADNLFGPVITSVSIPRTTFQSFLTKTNNYIMFKVVDNKAIILDDKRNVISPAGININPSDVFTVYKVSVVDDLLSRGNDNTVYIQQRSNVLSVSTGDFTMEVGSLCPPFCP
jgi:hypothetical protein